MKKYILLLIVSVIALGVFTALNSHITPENITLIFSYKTMLIYTILIIILYIISLIGLPIYFIFTIIDLFISGILLYLFYLNYNLLGIIYILVYIIFKLPLYFLLILNTFYTYKYAKNLYRFIFNKFGQSIKNIKLYFKKITIISIITTIYLAVFILIGNIIIAKVI